MKINQLNGFAFDKESKEIGAIAGVDFIKQTMSILTDEDETVVAKLGNVVFLEEIGTIGGTGVINHNVLTSADGKLYEIELTEDGQNVVLHLINDKLERVESGEAFSKEKLNELSPYLTLLDNINLLEPVEDKTVDFNIVIVRSQAFGDGFEYFYACNNEEAEEVDLIKVVFVGNKLLETKYERITVSHEEYLEMVEDKLVTEVTPQELMNYVTGLTYGHTSSVSEDVEEGFEEEDFEEDCCEDEDRFYCDDCGEDEEDCDCNEW